MNSSNDKLLQLAEKAAGNILTWLIQNLTLCLALPWLFCVRYHFGEIFILKHLPHLALGLFLTLCAGYASPNAFFPEQHPSLYVLFPITLYAVVSAFANYAICIHLSLAEPAVVWDSKSDGIRLFDSKAGSADRLRWSDPIAPFLLSLICARYGLAAAEIWFLVTGLALWLHHTVTYYKQYMELLDARDRMIQDGEIRSQQDLDLILWLTQAANGEVFQPMPEPTAYQPNDRLKILLQQVQARHRLNVDVVLPPSIQSLPSQTRGDTAPKSEPTYDDLALIPNLSKSPELIP